MALEVPLAIQKNEFMMKKLRSFIAPKLAAKKSVLHESSESDVSTGCTTGHLSHPQHAEHRKWQQAHERLQEQLHQRKQWQAASATTGGGKESAAPLQHFCK